MNFSLILFIALVTTGVISLIYKLMFEKKKDRSSNIALAKLEESKSQPLIVEYARALFPVFLIVFVLRSFIVEPFRIPSGSMLPNLHLGDFILVNKFSYGVRLPIIHKKIIPVTSPERGDVMVFRYPNNPKLNYIKRVIGIPGDTLEYKNKKLIVNGEEAVYQDDGQYAFKQIKLLGKTVDQVIESFDGTEHVVVNDSNRQGRDMTVTVPEGQYFVMGDNRDHSNDSRFWRFVPESHIVGNAFFIWFSWKSKAGGGVDWKRIGNKIQ